MLLLALEPFLGAVRQDLNADGVVCRAPAFIVKAANLVAEELEGLDHAFGSRHDGRDVFVPSEFVVEI